MKFLYLTLLFSFSAFAAPAPMRPSGYVDNVSDLTNTPPLNNMTLITRGYQLPGDGGGLSFTWNATATNPPNAVYILPSAVTNVGRWIANWSGSVKAAGAIVDDGLNDSTSINRSLQSGSILRFPPGLYNIGATLDITNGSRMIGEDATFTRSTLGGHFQTYDSTNLYIGGFDFINTANNNDPQGFTTGGRYHHVLLRPNSRIVTIENNTFMGFGSSGIRVQHPSVSDVIMRGNFFDSVVYPWVVDAWNTQLDGLDFGRFIFTDSIALNVGGDGMLLNRPTDENPIREGWDGIMANYHLEVDATNAWQVIDNQDINDNRGMGLNLAGNRYFVANNLIMSHRRNGLHIEDSASRGIIGNVIIKPSQSFPSGVIHDGVHAIGFQDYRLHNLWIGDHKDAGIFVFRVLSDDFDGLQVSDFTTRDSPYGVRIFPTTVGDKDNRITIRDGDIVDARVNGARLSGGGFGVRFQGNTIYTPQGIPIQVVDPVMGMEIWDNVITGIPGAGAKFQAQVNSVGTITNLTLLNGGANYVVTDGRLTHGYMVNFGSGYSNLTNVSASGSTGSNALFTLIANPAGNVVEAQITSGGMGYKSGDTLTFLAGNTNATYLITGVYAELELNDEALGGRGKIRVTGVNGGVAGSLVRRTGGSGYVVTNLITSTTIGGAGSNATFSVNSVSDTFYQGAVSTYSLLDGGAGYSTFSHIRLNGGNNDAVLRVTGVNGSGTITAVDMRSGFGFTTNNVVLPLVTLSGSGIGATAGLTNNTSVGVFTTPPTINNGGFGYQVGDRVALYSSAANAVPAYFTVAAVSAGPRAINDFILTDGGENFTNATLTVAQSYLPNFRRKNALLGRQSIRPLNRVSSSVGNNISPTVICELPRFMRGVWYVEMFWNTNGWARSAFDVEWDGENLAYATIETNYTGTAGGVTAPITLVPSYVTNNVLAWELLGGLTAGRSARWHAWFEGQIVIGERDGTTAQPLDSVNVEGTRVRNANFVANQRLAFNVTNQEVRVEHTTNFWIRANDTLDFGALEPQQQEEIVIVAPGSEEGDFALLSNPTLGTNAWMQLTVHPHAEQVIVRAYNSGTTTNDPDPQLVNVLIFKQ